MQRRALPPLSGRTPGRRPQISGATSSPSPHPHRSPTDSSWTPSARAANEAWRESQPRSSQPPTEPGTHYVPRSPSLPGVDDPWLLEDQVRRLRDQCQNLELLVLTLRTESATKGTTIKRVQRMYERAEQRERATVAERDAAVAEAEAKTAAAVAAAEAKTAAAVAEAEATLAERDAAVAEAAKMAAAIAEAQAKTAAAVAERAAAVARVQQLEAELQQDKLLRSAVAAAGDAKAQGAALCTGLAALTAAGSEIDKAVAEGVKINTEVLFPDAGDGWAEQTAAMTKALVGGVLDCFRRALDGVASGSHEAAAERVELKGPAATVSIKKAELPPIASWTHPTDGVLPVESASRWTADEWRSNMAALAAKTCAADEALACHFTSNASAHLILSDKSHGLRASTVGQLDGGVSLCLLLPHDMGWKPYGRGAFRLTTGRYLWGEKAPRP